MDDGVMELGENHTKITQTLLITVSLLRGAAPVSATYAPKCKAPWGNYFNTRAQICIAADWRRFIPPRQFWHDTNARGATRRCVSILEKNAVLKMNNFLWEFITMKNTVIIPWNLQTGKIK